MMALAVGLGILGIFALRRARRRCYAGGYHAYGWHGPWSAGEYDDDGPPPWMHHRHRRGRGGRWMLHAALARIDATPAQERVIIGEIDRLKERARTARGGLQEARVDLAAAMRGPALDDAALGAVLGRVDSTTSEMRAAALEALRNVHAVLDDKQRAEVADMIERGRRGGGPGGGRGFRMGPYR